MVWAHKTIRASRPNREKALLRQGVNRKKIEPRLARVEIKLKSLIMAQIERWRHA